SLPSETLKCGLFEGKQPSDAAEMGRFKDIYPMAHRLNVPLQVFSGETTLSLRIDLGPQSEGILRL
ncbi:MAG TPA: hypothetical protein VLK23_15275, partial [Thermodesulfobacteriota bacterium]|nr:hypothetical protein [Thermodesulfobacteriota bacterium]